MKGLFITDFANPEIGIIGKESIEPCPGAELPSGLRAFATFFTPALRQAPRYFWLTDGWESTPFGHLYLDKEEVFDQLRVSNVAGPLFRPGILPYWANYLRDDWCNLVALEKPQENAVAVAREIMASRDESCNYSLVEQYSPLVFYCSDGFSWEMYSRDTTLLDITESHVRSLGNFTVKSCELGFRDAGHDEMCQS